MQPEDQPFVTLFRMTGSDRIRMLDYVERELTPNMAMNLTDQQRRFACCWPAGYCWRSAAPDQE
jgi:hypothetical protein